MIETYEDYDLIIKENEKLMKKSLRMIISFFTVFTASIVLFIILQGNKFFIFNLNRTFENTPSPLIAEIFSVFFLIIIIIGLISYLSLSTAYFERKHQNIEKQIDSYEAFQKRFNLADIFSVVPYFLIVVIIINGFFFSFAKVDGISMQPTFCNNDAVVIKYVNEYEDQDIVILVQDNMYLIKRLVGLPGDTLLVNSTGVYINGNQIEDNVSNVANYYDGIIPDGQYYVLGDNRDYSQDSRYFGLVMEDEMLGKVILKVSNTTCGLQ